MSRRYAKLLAQVNRAMAAPLSRWGRIGTLAQLSSALTPRVPVDTPRGRVTLYTPSKSAIYWARHGIAAEPDTLRWIDGLARGSVVWDIGASVGLYSLYAGLRGDLEVLAFEANPFTYECLLRNVAENGMQRRVRPYCAALADTVSLGTLYMSSAEAGTVGNAFGDPQASSIRSSAGDIAIPMLSLSIDESVGRFHAPFPNHIKIDVDSIEDRIIAGGKATLGDPRVSSVLVEIVEDSPALKQRAEAIHVTMLGHGFRLDSSIASASGNRLFIRSPRPSG